MLELLLTAFPLAAVLAVLTLVCLWAGFTALAGGDESIPDRRIKS